MNGTILDVTQRSPEWYAARLGRVCSSDADAMLATIQKGEAAGRRNLRVRLMLERVTGKPQGSDYQTDAMRNGIEREADAFALYEAQSGILMRRCGFIAHVSLMAGWSPDGFTDDGEGFVEIKSPEPATHLETLKTRKVPTKYLRQVLHGGFWIGGAEWGDFVSYHPEFPEKVQLIVLRLHRRDFDVPAHELAVRGFLAEVEAEVQALERLVA